MICKPGFNDYNLFYKETKRLEIVWNETRKGTPMNSINIKLLSDTLTVRKLHVADADLIYARMKFPETATEHLDNSGENILYIINSSEM